MARNDRRPPHGRPAGPGAGHDVQSTSPLTDQQRAQVDALLSQLPDMAEHLRAVRNGDREDFSAPLAPVTDADEEVALAFAIRLGELRSADARNAIDVAQAIGELDTRPEVAREARRSRLRLRSSGALPTLNIPPVQIAPGAAPAMNGARTATATTTSAPAATTAAPSPATGPRLVEAHVSRTRESGEITLVLGWQEGDDPEFVRGTLFELDFSQDGVRRFVQTETMRRRRFLRETVEKIHQGEGGVHVATVPVTWAQARRLVLEALAVNDWRGREPVAEFKQQRAMLDKRLLGEPSDEEAQQAVRQEDERAAHEGDRPYLATDLEPDETVANWIGAWSFGDYGLAYDLLADDNPIRRKESRADYIALRRQWADEAKPAAMRLTLVREQEQRASGLWVPGAAGALPGANRDVEAFWSLSLDDTPLAGQIDEMPMATMQSPTTGRHWFWTGYTLARDRTYGIWQITRVRDEGRQSQGLPIEELQKRIAEARQTAERIVREAPERPREDQAIEAVRGLTGALTSAMHYADALMARLPLDESVYHGAVNDANSLANHERAAAVLERMQGRFANAVRIRFDLGVEQYLVAEQYGQQGQTDIALDWFERSIATLTEVAEEEPTVEHLQALGELLGRRGRVRQAEQRFRQALELDASRATLYSDLASVLMARASGEDVELEEPLTNDQRDELAREALALLRQAGKLDINLPHLFTRIGAIYEVLHQHEDSRLAFEEAVRRDPGDAEARYTLGALYLERNDPEKAIPLLESAVQLEPVAVPYRLLLAQAYIQRGQRREALHELDAIDKLQPHLPQVSELRGEVNRLAKKK